MAETAETEAPRRVPRTAMFLIASVLGLQVALAVSYYLDDDPYDERFAWRMYSTVRLTGCKTFALERQHPTGPERAMRLQKTLTAAWISHIKRNKDVVIRSALSARCENSPIAGARITNVCTKPGEESTRFEWVIDCETGTITRGGETP